MFTGSGETLSMEPAEHITRSDSANYDRLRTRNALWRAWGRVRETGRMASQLTRKEIALFEQHDVRNIERIGDRLRRRTFSFGLATGIPIRRPGKKPRPVVVSPLDARIVQRALLDELQGLDATKKYLENDHSFGCVPRKSRGDAIAVAQQAVDDGALYFIRSDICEFFTRVPRPSALAPLAAALDPEAAALLAAATEVELVNASRVDLSLFPTEDRGVAQGQCLSPLLGNVVLHEFDSSMNGRGILCLRYVDDFLILGSSEAKVLKAFDSAQRMLKGLGMDAYDPRTNVEKADSGKTAHGFDFLGCTLERGLIRPTCKSSLRLLERVSQIFLDAESHLALAASAHARRASLQRVLYDVGNVLRGWRDSFRFCEHPFVFNDIEAKVDASVQRFLRQFQRRYRQASRGERRLLLGLPMLGTE